MAIRVVLVQAFRPKPAIVDRMPGAAAHPDNLAAGDADVDPAADRANAARRPHPTVNARAFISVRETRSGHAGFSSKTSAGGVLRAALPAQVRVTRASGGDKGVRWSMPGRTRGTSDA